MPAKHDELWARLHDVLSTRGALPSGNATPGEIAEHAARVLPTDAVRRFVHDYYYKKQFGATDDVLSDAEADTLVDQVEAMPVAKPTTSIPPAQDNKGADAPPKPAAKPPGPSHEVREALAVSDVNDDISMTDAVELELRRPARRNAETPTPPAKPLPKPPEPPVPVTAPAPAVVPAPAPPPAAPASLLASARAKMEAGEHKAAAALFKKYLEQKPDDVNANLQLANCLDKLGQTQRALEVASRALAFDPSESALWNSIGVYGERLKQYDTSLSGFREATRLNPQSALYHRNLGRLLQGQKSFSEAAASFRQVVSLEADDYGSWMDAVRCLDNAGQTDAALETVRDLLEHKPDFADARNYLGSLLHKRKDYTIAAVAFKTGAEANAAQEKAIVLRPATKETRKNWHAFLEMLCWLAGIAPLAASYLAWALTEPSERENDFVSEPFVLVLGLTAFFGLAVRFITQKAMRGNVAWLGAAAMLIGADLAAYYDVFPNHYVNPDAGTWLGVLGAVVGGLFWLTLHLALLGWIWVYSSGRGGEQPEGWEFEL
ncbi:tetratricopeptide repeat protein [Candidatus Parcubacteria bacterium]|nr:tetratricopeptide repeat protein [Candidatus Parcubacteria bacterium]